MKITILWLTRCWNCNKIVLSTRTFGDGDITYLTHEVGRDCKTKGIFSIQNSIVTYIKYEE
jgi:hypothetical protein